MNTTPRIFWLVLLILALTACAPLVRNEQASRPDSVTLNQTQSAGQTFLSRFAGLSGIEVYIEPVEQVQGNLFFHLKESSKSQQDLRTVILPESQITQPGFQRFDFLPIPDSALKSYYFYLHTDGSYLVGTSGGDRYLNGSQYLNDLAIDSQSSFRLVYSPYMAIIGLIIDGFRYLRYLGAALFLFILPGWALLSWFSPDWDLNSWFAKFTLSIGLSLPVYPLVLLWTDLVGVHLGAILAWLPPIIAIIALGFRNRNFLRHPGSAMRRIRSNFPTSLFNSPHLYPDLLLILLVGLILLVRFWPIRTLPAPMWGDSYQHTMISQLLVDNNGLFNNWLPYADLFSFTYHYGFHSLTAVFHWVTGLPLPLATLWVGQIVNVLAVLALYPLATRLGRSPWAGVIAILLAGLLSPMPMFYTNWGRYTQLAGQAILPAAVLIAWDRLEKPTTGWRPYLLAWIVFAGLALTHYRILIFAAFFFIAYFILNYRQVRVSGFARPTALMAFGAGILFLPWFTRVFAGKLPLIFRTQITTPASQVSAFTEQYNSIGDLFTFLPAALWLLLPVALAWGFWRRERNFALVVLWWFIIFLSANPNWFNLPGSGVINNFAVFIAAYIPASLILGTTGSWVLGSFISWQTDKNPPEYLESSTRVFVSRLSRIAIILALLLAGIFGARLRIKDIQPAQFALVTWPDMRAAGWIRDNISPEARFLVNSFSAYGGDVIVGSDAGWWLPLLSGRATTLPPVNYGSEKGPRPDYRQWINSLTAEIEAKGISHPDVMQQLKERGVTHIYIGQQQGQVNNPGFILEPAQLLKNPNFKPIYHQDRTWIFAINPP